METCRDITQHVLLRYSCSKCKTLLRESNSPFGDLDKTSESCPSCGSQLAETLQVDKPVLQTRINPQIQVQTAYELSAKLTFDIPELDESINVSLGDRLCIVGSRRHANMILTRLWVRALMPQRHGGLASKHVICIDGGNCTNLYQCVSFARQYGMDVKTVLKSVVLSRAFTVYQLTSLIVRMLPKIIQRFKTKLIVISDLLHMFVDDPSIRYREAQYLLREIRDAIARLPNDILVILSLYNDTSEYDKLLLPTFSKKVEIQEGDKSLESLRVYAFQNSKLLVDIPLTYSDLRVVYAYQKKKVM